MEIIEEKGLESLVLWHKAVKFAVQISQEIVKHFPDEEKWALASQIRRSSQSVPANIAEGYGRFYYQEGVRFAYIARGSLEETFSHLTFAHEMGYISSEQFAEILVYINEIKKMINGYIAYLKRTKRGVKEPGVQYFTQGSREVDTPTPNP